MTSEVQMEHNDEDGRHPQVIPLFCAFVPHVNVCFMYHDGTNRHIFICNNNCCCCWFLGCDLGASDCRLALLFDTCEMFLYLGTQSADIIGGSVDAPKELRSFAVLNLCWTSLLRLMLAVPQDQRETCTGGRHSIWHG